MNDSFLTLWHWNIFSNSRLKCDDEFENRQNQWRISSLDSSRKKPYTREILHSQKCHWRKISESITRVFQITSLNLIWLSLFLLPIPRKTNTTHFLKCLICTMIYHSLAHCYDRSLCKWFIVFESFDIGKLKLNYFKSTNSSSLIFSRARKKFFFDKCCHLFVLWLMLFALPYSKNMVTLLSNHYLNRYVCKACSPCAIAFCLKGCSSILLSPSLNGCVRLYEKI